MTTPVEVSISVISEWACVPPHPVEAQSVHDWPCDPDVSGIRSCFWYSHLDRRLPPLTGCHVWTKPQLTVVCLLYPGKGLGLWLWLGFTALLFITSTFYSSHGNSNFTCRAFIGTGGGGIIYTSQSGLSLHNHKLYAITRICFMKAVNLKKRESV